MTRHVSPESAASGSLASGTSVSGTSGSFGTSGRVLKAVLAGSTAALLLGLAAPHASADSGPAARPAPPAPSAPSDASRGAAHDAAEAPKTLDTLSRFFAREGAVTKAAAEPRVAGDKAVPVYYLSPDFVAGKKDAPVARMEFLASKAVSSDGQEASLWSVRQGGSWKIVNIATGDDETRYARVGADKLPGGTVFHEPQINGWYVTKGTRVLPLDKDAVRAVGAEGTSTDAYRKRVHKAYGDKLPGSAYAKSGKAGGYAEEPAATSAKAGGAPESASSSSDGAMTVASSVAGAGALVALGLSGAALLRRRSRRLS
ncbi:hypothetical protein [Streptomyces flavofungini]|uniref:hypothetical protein n=1 Tax=Streptomyces flavofungini TaxID=68200 RepID=UPI0019B6B65E|nr:hypothetical protein [Streptomyces flavofungini]GHC64286.1 hypothetical protein GCM10010349_35330 [Streptomyces flavofungini]